MKITEEVLFNLAQALAPEARREFKVPSLPPGVVPKGQRYALDSAAGTMSWLNAQPGWCGLGFPGYSYLSELAQRSEYRAPTETIAKEMTREWGTFEGVTTEQREELEEAFTDFGVRETFRLATQYDGFFGRGMLYIGIKGQESDARRQLPLMYDPQTIPKGSLLTLKAVEPIWTTPYMYNAIDPTKPDFYCPSAWYMLGKRTHATRLLTFISRPLPDMLKPAYNFGGMSLSQLIEPYVTRWLKTVDSVNRLISNYSVLGIQTNMQATLEGSATGESLAKRAQLFNLMRDNRGLLMLDKDSEQFFQFNTPLNALPDLQSQAQEHMAAPTHIPLVKLTGISPAGLNASSEGEIKVFYDFIEAEQEDLYNHNMDIVLKVVQCHLWGKIDPAIHFKWKKLDSPTDAELAKIRTADSNSAKAYLDAGVISKTEERRRLRLSADSGYEFLESDDPPADAKEATPPQVGAKPNDKTGKDEDGPRR
jgi:uncharacterized protein